MLQSRVMTLFTSVVWYALSLVQLKRKRTVVCDKDVRKKKTDDKDVRKEQVNESKLQESGESTEELVRFRSPLGASGRRDFVSHFYSHECTFLQPNHRSNTDGQKNMRKGHFSEASTLGDAFMVGTRNDLSPESPAWGWYVSLSPKTELFATTREQDVVKSGKT